MMKNKNIFKQIAAMITAASLGITRNNCWHKK